MSVPATFPAFRIHGGADGHRSGIEPLTLQALAPGEVVIKAAWKRVGKVSKKEGMRLE